MLSEITHQELIEWQVFSELEPFFEERLSTLFAGVRATTLDTVRDRKKRKQPFEFKDFIIFFGDEKAPPQPKKSWQTMKAMMKQFAAEQNGTARKKSAPKRKRANG